MRIVAVILLVAGLFLGLCAVINVFPFVSIGSLCLIGSVCLLYFYYFAKWAARHSAKQAVNASGERSIRLPSKRVANRLRHASGQNPTRLERIASARAALRENLERLFASRM
jgi:hypothetical protein